MEGWLETLSGLRWPLVLGLAATGIPMALLSSLVGLRQKVEIPLWWALYAGWVVVVLSTGVEAVFTTITVASLLAGIAHSATQALLVRHYRRNNPWYAEQMQGSDGKLAAGFLVMGVVIGLGFGAVVGLVAWALARL